jgi:aryl-alcohol dehydrogenase-like predicted oxidoreductase
VQNRYNVLDRAAEPLLAECRAHGVAWVPFFPLGSAFAAATRVPEQPTVTAAAADLAVTPGQVGLAWLLAHDPGTLLIPGTRSTEHLAENMAAADVHLDAATMAKLNALAPAC